MKRFLPYLLSGLSLVACADSAGAPLSSPALELSLTSPPELVLAADGTASTLISLETDSHEGPLTLSVVGLPKGLEATFGEHVNGQVELRIDTVAPVEKGLYPTHLVAKLNSTEGIYKGSAALSIRVPDSLIFEVSGQVVDALGLPVPAVEVSIDGEVLTTDEAGRFTTDATVRAPYNIVIRETPTHFHVYEGLTRETPVLHLVTTLDPDHLETAELTVTSSGAKGLVEGFAVTGDRLWGGGLGASIRAYWPKGATHSGLVYGLSWEVDDGLQPSKFVGFGRAQVDSLSTSTKNAVDLGLDPVGTGFIAGEVTLPEGHTLTSRTLWLPLGPRTSLPLATLATSSPTFTMAVPDIGFPTGVQVSATGLGGQIHRYVPGLVSGAIADIALPEAPQLIAPAIAESITRASRLSFTGQADAVRLVAITGSGLTVSVYTTDDDIALPESPELGLELPSGGYKWLVSTIGTTQTDLDSFASKDGGLPFFGLEREVTLGYSQPGAFVLSE